MQMRFNPRGRRVSGNLTTIASIAFILMAMMTVAVGGATRQAAASSHREAPFISTDPEADNTDLYAFVSPNKTDTVTIIANYVPLEEPNGGPNFPAFGENVLYEIKIDNVGDGADHIIYQFTFHNHVRNPGTFLYNTGPISTLTDPNWNLYQTYDVTRVENGSYHPLATDLYTPPDNVGPRSTPNYDALAAQAVHPLAGRKFFAGQRDDPFFVDLGSIFDLAGLRPFNPYHLIPLAASNGVDGLHGFNVHSIAIQVPITDLTSNHRMPTSSDDPHAVIGVYASASRHRQRILLDNGTVSETGAWQQISRLGEPLINEAVIGVGQKDFWNAKDPENDSQFASSYTNPLLSVYENALYGADTSCGGHSGGALQCIDTTNRSDLALILLNGVPLPNGHNLNYTGSTQADLVRLNMAIPPSTNNPNTVDRLGLLNGQLDGFPDGRRLADDVVDIELRATAQGYGPFLNSIYPTLLPDKSPNDQLGDGVNANDAPFMPVFPYEGKPWQGYDPAHHNGGSYENNRDLNDQ